MALCVASCRISTSPSGSPSDAPNIDNDAATFPDCSFSVNAFTTRLSARPIANLVVSDAGMSKISTRDAVPSTATDSGHRARQAFTTSNDSKASLGRLSQSKRPRNTSHHSSQLDHGTLFHFDISKNISSEKKQKSKLHSKTSPSLHPLKTHNNISLPPPPSVHYVDILQTPS